jgi:putative ATP-dependent endonuclease of the OLD family
MTDKTLFVSQYEVKLMQIRKISVKNFRTLEDAEIDFGNNYCTISGKNNAGKSCIIRLLSALLYKDGRHPWQSDSEIDFEDDKTQWLNDDQLIEIEYLLNLNKSDDSSLVTFVAKLSDTTVDLPDLPITVKSIYGKSRKTEHFITVAGNAIEGSLAKDVLHKLKTSNLLFLHNSTNHDEIYFGGSKRLALVEFVLSEYEKRQIVNAEAQILSRIKKLAKQHKDELQTLLGKLQEKHSVEFSTLDASYSRHIPLGIRLVDNNVNVPINEWGSGTQNKTYILLSILWANRIKTQGKEDEKITPIVVVEEPESFLHPSAQAEFGRLLSSLAVELGIQIIVTTHSPYMLNRDTPASNILVRRNQKGPKKCPSEIIIPEGDNWMLPFSEHLGISAGEFQAWAPLFRNEKRRILLVEGPIDKSYFDFIQEKQLISECLPEDIEIVPYGGKDALRNTVLLKFALEKYGETYITFDLDVLNEVKRAIEAIGYKDGITYFAIGKDMQGHKDIEGLLPEKVRSSIFSKNTSLVTQAIGGDRSAKNELKNLYLEEFCRTTSYTEEDLKGFKNLFKKINKGIKANHKMQPTTCSVG